MPVNREYKKIPLDKLFQKLKTDSKGLSDLKAAIRLRIYGPNEIEKKKRVNPAIKFLSYFKSPLIIVLLAAALLSGLTGEFKSAGVIIVMVLVSIILNFYQEHKSNKSAERIAKKLSVRATVIRQGEKKDIDIKYVVPGDIVYLLAGDIVPADGRLIKTDDFFVNESALTGESFPAKKTASDRSRHNTVSAGTNVVSGYSQFVAVNTGAKTEYGKIVKQLSAADGANAFEAGVRSFGYLVVKVILGIVLLIFLINAIAHKDIIDSFIFSLAVAVGVTPELLPMIISVNLARGSIRMAKQGVLVKRLNAIPDFGSMDILCTDKTGTLTEDKISLIKHLDVFGQENQEVLKLAYINGYYETGIKSILDKAILEFKDIGVRGFKKVDEIPYDFMRKRSSVIYEIKADHLMVTKGAPEEIFKICSKYRRGNKNFALTPAVLKKANRLYEQLSADGLRTLAVATKNVSDYKEEYAKGEEAQMVLTGLVAFYDPPKAGVKKTLVFMKQHGIEVKVLTGDSPLVTKKICHDLGLEIKGIISGEDLDINELGADALAVKAMGATIMARLSPSQKEAIISALRQKGFVVGYLGDGINDAPALKAADVGISVENAVDVTKETADIILMKKGLKELMGGVIEGRRIFGNTMKYLMMGLSSNFGNMFSMVGAAIYLPFFPLLPGQILLNNFLYDMSQLAIPADNVDSEYLKKPKHWDMKFIRNVMYVFGPVSSLFDILTFVILYAVLNMSADVFRAGWFIESLMTQTLVIYVIRTRKIPFLQSRPNKYLFLSTTAIICIGLAIIYSSVGNIFGFGVLPVHILLVIIGLVITYLCLVEIIKHLFYRFVYREA